MKTFLIITICFFSQLVSRSQVYNLIPNSSFEFCPKNNNDDTLFSKNGCWKKLSSRPDLINQNETNSIIKYPKTGNQCYQFLDNGAKYSYITASLKDSTNMNRGYLQSKLNYTLVLSNIYYFSINIGYKKNTTSNFNSIFSAYTKNFGVSFSSYEVNYIFGSVPYYSQPQINFTSWDFPLNDTFMYVTLKGSYIANGTEQYITIGNFDRAYQLNNYFNPYFLASDTGVYSAGSNLFIDDLTLVSDTTQPIISLDQFLLGNDTTICPNTNLTIGGEPYFFHYWWNTGDTTRFITINQPGKYWCEVDYGCSTYTDTIEVFLDNTINNFQLTGDTLLCNNASTTLSAPPNFSYLWNTSEQTQSIQVNQTGTYSCSCSNACGNVSGSINVVSGSTPNTNPLIKGETNLCVNGIEVSKILSTDSPYELLWSNGSHAQSIIINQPGEFWLKEKNECGEHTEKVNVTGCIPFIVFPTAFSPNQDGKNEDFKPITKNVEEFKYSIYNRYGNCVFKNDNALFGWDGKYKTVDCPIGTYFYICKYKINNQEKILKGDFELVR